MVQCVGEAYQTSDEVKRQGSDNSLKFQCSIQLVPDITRRVLVGGDVINYIQSLVTAIVKTTQSRKGRWFNDDQVRQKMSRTDSENLKNVILNSPTHHKYCSAWRRATMTVHSDQAQNKQHI